MSSGGRKAKKHKKKEKKGGKARKNSRSSSKSTSKSGSRKSSRSSQGSKGSRGSGRKGGAPSVSAAVCLLGAMLAGSTAQADALHTPEGYVEFAWHLHPALPCRTGRGVF